MFKTSLSPLKIFAGAGIVLLMLVVTLLLSFKRFNDLTNANHWDVHTYQVLLETSNAMRGLVNIQSGSRGFVQTGQEEFLEPYNLGRKEFSRHYAAALELTSDNPLQQKRLQLLKRQYTIWMRGHIDPLIRMRRATPDMTTALQLASTGVRKRKIVMDAMRLSVDTIEGKERELLAERSAHEKKQLGLTKLTLIYNGAFTLVVAMGLSVLMAIGTRKMELLNRRLNEQVERSKKAERDAEVFNNHNKMLLEAARDGIAGVNRAGRTTFFNPAAEAITGYREEEVLGKPHHELLHSKRADGSPYPLSECPITATLQDGKAHHASNEVFWHKNGRAVPIEFTTSPLISSAEDDEDSKQVGAVVVFRDITERQKSQAALQEMASIITYADDAIISFKLDGRITNWNRAATSLYGFTELEMIGQYMERLLPPNRRDELPELIEQLKRNESVARYQTTRLCKDGKSIPVILSIAPIKDINGQVTGVSSISRETWASKQSRAASVSPPTAPSEM